MKADDARQHFEALQADLAQESDPQLRSWYETEVSLTEEHQEAETLRNQLATLASGLAGLVEVENEVTTGPDSPETPTVEAEAPEDDVDQGFDFEEYVSPQERKQRSTVAWVKEINREYGRNLSAANAQTKRSKQEKHRDLARKRYLQHFERFGESGEHILHDPEALGYALDELSATKPRLAEIVTVGAEQFMRAKGPEFVQDYAALAGIIRGGIDDRPSQPRFERILSAAFDRDFGREPESAATLYIAMAHAVFEAGDRPDNLPFYKKIADTIYFQNDIIGPKREFMAAIEVSTYMATQGNELLRVGMENMNARIVFHGLRHAYLGHPKEHYATWRAQYSEELAARTMMTYKRKYGLFDEVFEPQGQEMKDFYRSPGYYDHMQVTDIDTGESLPTETDGRELPAMFREPYRDAELYKKRMQYLSPRAVAHDMIYSSLTASNAGNFEFDGGRIVDITLSPGVAVTAAFFLLEGDDHHLHSPAVTNDLIATLLEKFNTHLTAEQYAPGDDNLKFGQRKYTAEFDSAKWFGMCVLRKTVPEDLAQTDPLLQLTTTYGMDVLDYTDIPAKRREIDAKKQHLQDHRHNYLGRRPVAFTLPDYYRERGLQRLTARQHPDLRHVLVTAEHNEGDINFTFNGDLSHVDLAHHVINYRGRGETPVGLAFENLVVSLISEWACREVVETSEGTVSNRDNRSPVNLGFLRYLPPGAGFSDRQRKIFAREQRGNLAAESRRRQPIDPTGQGRNSTYVKENFDPSRPALEIYYDPEAIEPLGNGQA